VTSPHRIAFALSTCLITGGVLLRGQAAPPRYVPIAAPVKNFDSEVAPVLQNFCVSCHGETKQRGGVKLSGLRNAADVSKHPEFWQRVQRMVAAGEMPPQGRPQPTRAQRDRMVRWIEAALASDDCGISNPGHVTLRRLNREEYNNTIRDLLDVDFRPADDFPSDDVGYGFDNIGDVLSISPLLMEKYLDAAEQIADKAIVVPLRKKVRWSGGDLTGKVGKAGDGGIYLLYSNGEAGIEYSFPADGTYLVRARAFEDHAGDEASRMEFRVDGKAVVTVNVEARRNASEIYEQKIQFGKGRHRVAVAFLNDFYKPELPQGQRDRNLYIESLEIDGPIEESSQLPASHRRIIFLTPQQIAADAQGAARTILTRLAGRAYRRPPTPEDIERLMRAYQLATKNGESFESGIHLALQAVLVSPHFLFRVEAEPKQVNGDYSLNSYELASRLSYFLWSSMPDDALLTVAARGELTKQAVLEREARRMLQDPKAKALADNFAGQWLMLRNLHNVDPDPKLFPDFNDKLREAMKQESLLFFDEVVSKDRSILDFLDGKFTYVNGDLARHYGIAGVNGDSFQRVVLTGASARERGGVLTQASVLTVTSNPTRTSPVKRGKWVLEQLLGTPPPPPPPGVPQLKENQATSMATSVRQRMQEHLKNPECASCHTRMDPIGFSLENYDAVGRWRTQDGNLPINASGTLPDSGRFVGPNQLKAILVQKRNQFARAFSEKMLTYALGRGLVTGDKCVVDNITKTLAAQDYRFSALITAIVLSDSFRKTSGEAKPQAVSTQGEKH
jgi:mono/diheme cytochrome c family protein